jgi:PAS domain S-box-containing protein
MNAPAGLSPDSRDIGRRQPLTIFGATVLLATFLLVRGGDSRADLEAHTLLDALVCSWAFFTGALALVRHYGLRSRPALFTGIAFLGASALDGGHALITSLALPSPLASELQALAEWSWIAPRIFVASFLALSASSILLPAESKVERRALFLVAGALLFLCSLPFLLVQLSGRQSAEILRTAAPLPAFAFLCGFAALLRKGSWRRDPFERSLVLSSLLGFLDSLLFMGLAGEPYGAGSLLAHLLKSAGYLVVLAALLTDVLRVFREAENSAADTRRHTEELDAHVAEGAIVEGELRHLGELLEERVKERTRDLEASRTEALQALDFARRAKFDARAAERRFRDVLEWALDPMIIADSQGTVTMVNNAAEKLFGYSKSELVGRPFEILIPKSVRSAHAQHRASFMAMPAVRGMGAGIELQARRKDGSLVPIEVSLNPIESPGGTLVSSVIQDLTERKKAEAEIARYTRDLERSNAELEQFAYVASHDLQEPLRIVLSFTQLLARRYRGKLDATADEFIAQAVDGARRMQGLIRDLLKYSLVGTKEEPFASVACDEVLTAVLGNLRFAIEESEALVTHEALPVVYADATQLGQLFQNLVANAIKFRAAEPPRVHVGAVRENGHWVFSVRDNGIGIEPGHLERAFEIFKRFHPGEEYPGTGIGLAICKRIVEKHRGKIWLDSRPGEGTVAYFSLPLTTEA